MLTRDDVIEETRARVLNAVRESSGRHSPMDLIDLLRRRGSDEDQVRVALWYLLDQHEIELTPDWKLDTPDHNDPLT